MNEKWILMKIWIKWNNNENNENENEITNE